jgi:hypothetical protein
MILSLLRIFRAWLKPRREPEMETISEHWRKIGARATLARIDDISRLGR